MLKSLVNKIRKLVKPGDDRQGTTEKNDNSINERLFQSGAVEVFKDVVHESSGARTVPSECLERLNPSSLIRQGGRTAISSHNPSGSDWSDVPDTVHPPRACDTLRCTPTRDNPVGVQPDEDRSFQSCDRLICQGIRRDNVSHNIVAHSQNGGHGYSVEPTTTLGGLSSCVVPESYASRNNVDMLPSHALPTRQKAECRYHGVGTYMEKRNPEDPSSSSCQENDLHARCYEPTLPSQGKLDRKINNSMDGISGVMHVPSISATLSTGIERSKTTVQEHQKGTCAEQTRLFSSEDATMPVCSLKQKPEQKTFLKTKQSVQTVYARISEHTEEFQKKTPEAKHRGDRNPTEAMEMVLYAQECIIAEQIPVFPSEDTEIPVFPTRQKLQLKTCPEQKQSMQNISENTKQFQKPKSNPTVSSNPTEAYKKPLVRDTLGHGSGARPKYVSNTQRIRTFENHTKVLPKENHRSKGHQKQNVGVSQRRASPQTHRIRGEADVTTIAIGHVATPRGNREHQQKLPTKGNEVRSEIYNIDIGISNQLLRGHPAYFYNTRHGGELVPAAARTNQTSRHQGPTNSRTGDETYGKTAFSGATKPHSAYRAMMAGKLSEVKATASGRKNTAASSGFGVHGKTANKRKSVAAEERRTYNRDVKNNTKKRTRGRQEQTIKREASVEADEYVVKVVSLSITGDPDLDNILLKKQKALNKHEQKMTSLRDTSEEQEASRHDLEAQGAEFESSTTLLLDRLRAVGHDATSNETVVQLRRRFGVECKRLETALPIYARRTDIVDTVRCNAVCVVLGETGSGKSTQLTQYVHEAGAAPGGKIVCTQPRKVAAISLATRVAQELATPLGGDLVGYRVGLQRRLNHNTALLYVTDHVLLNECLRDPLLKSYSCIIIDEAHERSIFTDLLLGMVKRCLASRKDLRVIITSATIDPELFVRYFGGCPVLKVHGRTYPVDVQYERRSDHPSSGDYLGRAVQKVKEIHATQPPGDILVFVPSALDTEKGCETTNQLEDVVSLPLHGGLPPNEQRRVFDPDIDGRRKIVFATNCAETSVTVPGIKYVVDTGLAKERTYDPKLNVSSLKLSVISRSSAEQRKGRAGRTAPGTCYRLYGTECYDNMTSASTPEILRVHIGQALLKLMEIGVDDPALFDYVESPPPAAMESAAIALESLGATTNGRINDLGRQLSQLNVQPRLGKVIILAIEAGIGFDGLIATALSTVGGYVFFRGVGNNEQETADKNKFRLCEEAGDVLTFVSLYKQWTAQPERAKNRWCVENSVNAKFMRLARDSVTDIERTLKRDLHMDVDQRPENKDAVDRLLAEILLECYANNLGFFSGHQRAGYWVATGGGAGTDTKILHLHPSSALASLGTQPRWIIFENIMVTSRPYVTNVTAINDDLVQRFVADGRLPGVDVAALSRQQLLACSLPPVGLSVMRALTGRGFEHLKRLEKETRLRCKTEMLMLDASFNESRLVVYVTPNLEDTATAAVTEKIASEKDRLAVELFEVALGGGGGGVRMVLGRGGAVTHLLMPDEYCTVVITDVADGVDVVDALCRIGPLVKYFRFKSEDRSGRWGKVTFAQPNDALRAVKDNSGPFSARPVGGSARAGTYSALTIKTKWCRRPTRGFAFVTMGNPEDVGLLCGNILVIRGRIVEVNINRKDNSQLYLKNLPSDVDELDISTALNRTFDDLSIHKVVIPRENVGATTPSELDHLQYILSAEIKKYVPTKGCRVEMMPPKGEKDFYYNARISFITAADGMTALQDLNGHVTIGGKPVTFTPDLRSSLTVAKTVYDVIREELHQVTITFSRDGSFVNVPKKLGENPGHVVIWIHSDSLSGLQKAADAVRRVIQPNTVEFGSMEEFRCITGPAGREELRRIEADSGAKISVDARLMNVLVHGSETARRLAVMSVDRFVQGNKTLLRKEVLLRDRGNTVRLMKLLLNKYGSDLEQLQSRTGALYLVLQLRRHTLVFRGTEDAYEALQRALHEDEAQLTDRPTTTPSADSPDCPVCFCPVDEDDVYRLEYCGHAYCRPCSGALLEHKCRDAEFPVKCIQEDCGEPIILRDMTNLLGHSAEARSRWHRAAVESLVKANREQYRYCITPDCPTVYRAATSRDHGVCFWCSQCSNVMCTSCHVHYHDGITCAAYQAMKRDDNVDINAWLREDSANRARCPSCKTPIEKDGGCNHLQCTGCHAHICWKCKAVFKDRVATYDHLSKYHAGIFDI